MDLAGNADFRREQMPCDHERLEYQTGFANSFATEACAGALPQGRNSPQKMPLGLVSELVSATTFSAPRALNRSSYLFKVRPSVDQGDFVPYALPDFRSAPLDTAPYPGPLRWGPFADNGTDSDFLNGLQTICGNGSPKAQTGMTIHVYRATRSMDGRVFSNADGEMLILPHEGRLRLTTELGRMTIRPGEFALLPRGLKFSVGLDDAFARGFVCENYGHPFVLPELGLIGSHGLANTEDFQTPVAAFEERSEPCELIHKYAGVFWSAALEHSPFDVVAWRGNWAPCKFDMHRFMTVGALGVDHVDPSIFCALTSPSPNPVSGANIDFMVLPPRWVVAEDTLRPPGFHRNAVAEFLGVLQGSHEARASDFPAGSFTLHNNWTPHGPDRLTFERAREAKLAPTKIKDTMIFMFESARPFELSSLALVAPNRQRECSQGWRGFTKRFSGEP